MMSRQKLDVVGIGNALVDVLTKVEPSQLAQLQLAEGVMTLIDPARAEFLYQHMISPIESSGGSAANTIYGLARLGANVGFMGRVGRDQLGQVFQHDLSSAGVACRVNAVEGATGRCLIFVSPSAARTMQTSLGVAVDLSPEDVDASLIAQASVVYLEGYLWDKPSAKKAFVHAAKLAHEHGRMVSLTLSDPFCVDRHRESFQELIKHHVDILFANEDEMKALYQVNNIDAAVAHVRSACNIACITRGGDGALIVDGTNVYKIAAVKPTQLVDTTGAGDIFASGFLYGLTHGWPVDSSGRLAVTVAAEVISHMGPRPQADMKKFIQSIWAGQSA